MFKRILSAFALIITVFLIYVALKPDEYSVSRSISIRASSDKIFPYINNSRLMNSWNPWMEIDPNVKIEFSGTEEGPGAKTSWQAGGQLGTGNATVIESVPNSSIKTRLEYIKPFVMTQNAEIKLTQSGDQTITTWTVSGKNNFICKLMSSVIDMDQMIGSTFEKGLNKLKILVESPSR